MIVQDRYYQTEAIAATETGWANFRSQLLSMPTGCGKTVVFGKIAQQEAARGNKVLILAHRDELIQQAADKILAVTGQHVNREQGSSHAHDGMWPITVGSVQTLHRKRLDTYWRKDAFDLVIIDEAHHALADSYSQIIQHFDSRLLGVTATPDRGDKKSLGKVFETIAYEYTLRKAIADGFLCQITAQLIPLKIDMDGVKTAKGDYDANDVDARVTPYLRQAAAAVAAAWGRKCLVFLPLVRTSQAFVEHCLSMGLRARHIDGSSEDRKEILRAFAADEFDVLANSSLLLEGYDCPQIDCVMSLRATKSRALYCLDARTEVLTKRGWTTKVSIGDPVAAFDPKTQRIAFLPATGVIERPLTTGEFFVSLKSQSVDIRVTNKHRMLYDHKRRTGWKWTTAGRLAELRDTSYLPVAGFCESHGVPLSDDELRFIGWVMTDGTINKMNNQITVTQGEHQPWVEEIQKCIEGCGFKHNRFARNRTNAYRETSRSVVWTISKGKPRLRDKHLRGWGAIEPWLAKDFSPLLMGVTDRQFDVLLGAIHLGDGAKQAGQTWTRRSYHISSALLPFVERLQECAVMHGYRANLSTHKQVTGNAIYVLHLKKQNWSRVGGQAKDRPSWRADNGSTQETCWCVENEWGTLVTRRNGKIAIVGNCQMIGRGTRIHPGKKDLLILDPLWQSTRHELCVPASLVAKDNDMAQAIMAQMSTGGGKDIIAAESDAQQARERTLAAQLAANARRNAKTINPLTWALSMHDEALYDYQPVMPWESHAATEKQLIVLARMGIDTDAVSCKGHASKLMDKLFARRNNGLCTVKQAAILAKEGLDPSEISFDRASEIIDDLTRSWKRKAVV